MRFSLVLPFALVVLGLSTTSCEKKQDPTPAPTPPVVPVTPIQPDPAAESSMDRSVIYLNSLKPNMLRNYTPSQIASAAAIKNSEFKFSTYADRTQSTSNDFLVMTIAASQLKPDLVGEYSLRSLPDPTQGVVYTSYSITGSSTFIYSQSDNRMQGTFRITAYDASRKLISGNYEVLVTSVTDPYDNYRSICDVKLAGTFQNIKVQ
jgi:hypothetical protein